jgi:hypothetical protein
MKRDPKLAIVLLLQVVMLGSLAIRHIAEEARFDSDNFADVFPSATEIWAILVFIVAFGICMVVTTWAWWNSAK